MKKLYIMRHGKATHNFNDYKDIERNLVPKGIERTSVIATFIKNKNIEIDAIYVSPAQRTLQTMNIIAKELNINNIIIEPLIYNARSEFELFDFIDNIDNEIDNVLIIGHNPTLCFFINNYIKPNIEHLPTSGTVGLSFDTSNWELIKTTKAKLEFIAFPKLINQNLE